MSLCKTYDVLSMGLNGFSWVFMTSEPLFEGFFNLQVGFRATHGFESAQAKLKKSHIVCTMRPLRLCIEENSGDISRCIKEARKSMET